MEWAESDLCSKRKHLRPPGQDIVCRVKGDEIRVVDRMLYLERVVSLYLHLTSINALAHQHALLLSCGINGTSGIRYSAIVFLTASGIRRRLPAAETDRYDSQR